jgi:hypothetical protein
MEVAGRTLKGQLKHAERLGARHVAVVGVDGATLRDAGGRTTGEALTPDEVLAAVRAAR